jgi:hypothetical protein
MNFGKATMAELVIIVKDDPRATISDKIHAIFEIKKRQKKRNTYTKIQQREKIHY